MKKLVLTFILAIFGCLNLFAQQQTLKGWIEFNTFQNGQKGMTIHGQMRPANNYNYKTEVVIIDNQGNVMPNGNGGYLDFWGSNVLFAQGGALCTSNQFVSYADLYRVLPKGVQFYVVMFICNAQTNERKDMTPWLNFQLY